MQMNSKPRLSPAETEILSLVWQVGNATVQDVHQALPQTREIANATVQTLLRRLEKKGYVARKKQGKAHIFWATVEKAEVVQRSVGELAERHFQGDDDGLLLYMAEHGALTDDDVARLRQLLDAGDQAKDKPATKS